MQADGRLAALSIKEGSGGGAALCETGEAPSLACGRNQVSRERG